MPEHDELDTRIRELVWRLVEASPPAPPFSRPDKNDDKGTRGGSERARSRLRLLRPQTKRGLLGVIAVAAAIVAVFVAPIPRIDLFGHGAGHQPSAHPIVPGQPIGTQLAELKGSGVGAGDGFGYSVAISGTTAVVGDVGRAFVFTKSAAGWKQTAELTGSDTVPGDCFGNSVAVSGAIIVVGAPCYSANSGRAYVFTKSAAGWKQTAELTGSDIAPGDSFGFSVDVSGTTIVVGAAFDPNRAGRAYVFTKSAAAWKQTAELTGSDTAPGDCFAESVAISGATVIAGAPGAGCNAGNAGRAYVFTNSPAGWRQTGELSGSDTVAGDAFGFSVAISGRTVLVGAYGHGRTAGRAYVFTNSPAGWRQTGELSGSDTVAGDWFGSSVAISGTTAVVGAFSDPPSANQSLTGVGRAYVFTRTAGTWAQVAELRHFAFAYSEGVSGLVAISGTTALIAADGVNRSEGRAYVFQA